MDLEASSSTLSTTCDTTTATQYHITKEQLWSEIKLITVWGLKGLTQLFLAGEKSAILPSKFPSKLDGGDIAQTFTDRRWAQNKALQNFP